MIDDKKALYRIISCIDIIAMFMILFYHSTNYIAFLQPGSMGKAMGMLAALFVVFGMTAFTYSSGFKLSFNHYTDFNDKKFFRKYMIQRTLSLYKPYVVYPVVTIVFLYALYYLFGFLGKQSLILPFFLQIGPLNDVPSVLVNFLFFGLPPVAGQLWYIAVLIFINLIVLTAMRLYGVQPILTGFFPLLLLYFIFNYHILGPISPAELRYYICLYLVIFLSGVFMGYLYHKNIRAFHRALLGLAGMFLLIMIGYFITDVSGKAFPENSFFNVLYGNAFYGNVFFRYGLTFPAFLMAALFSLRNTKIVSTLSVFRNYILLIYMLQYPFTIPFYSRLLSKTGFYSLPLPWLAPLLVSLLSIITCIILYKIYKQTLDLITRNRTVDYTQEFL